MESVTLKQRSTHWRDRAVGWHLWAGTATCPTCGKAYRTTLAGTRESAESYNGDCEDCDN